MRIKICGLTRLDDALHAAALGADALGFVVWPGSPRAVTLPHLRLLVEQLPPFVTVVGVFVDPAEDDRGAGRRAFTSRRCTASVPIPRGPAVLPAVHLAAHGGAIEPPVAGSGAVLLDTPTTRPAGEGPAARLTGRARRASRGRGPSSSPAG